MAENSPITAADKLFRGRRYVEEFAVNNASGSPQVMTGWIVGYKWTNGQHGTTALIDWSSAGAGSANIVVDPAGTVTVALPGSVTAPFEGSEFPNYWRELRRIEDNGDNDTLLAFGEVVLRESS